MCLLRSKIQQDSTNRNTLYVLTAGGGLWKSYDFFGLSGPHWIPLTDTLPTTSSGSFALGSATDTIYLGLGDPYQDMGIGGMMVVSNDGGNSWNAPVSLAGATYIYDIKVEVSQAADIILITAQNGIHRSSDAGSTYNLVYNSPTSGSTYSIVKSSIGWIGYDYVDGILISYDFGITWLKGITNWDTVVSATGYQAKRATLEVAVAGDNVVFAYAARLSDNHQLDLFRSRDGGLTWIALGCNSNKRPTNSDPCKNISK